MQGKETDADILARISQKWQVAAEPLAVDGAVYQILAIQNMPEHLDRLAAAKAIGQPLRDLPLWAAVWPGSLVLGRFLRKFAPQGKTLLDLGCGMGALSLVASAYGFAHITAADVNADALDFAAFHMLKNGLGHLVDVLHVDIAAPRQHLPVYDIIAASELLYLDDLHRPLLKFLQGHLRAGGKAIFCTDMARQKPRFQKLAAKNFAVTEGKIGVKSTDADGAETRRIYSILILEKK